MKKIFMIAALIVSLVLCNDVSAANYGIRPNPEIATITFPDNTSRTGIWFTIQDLADNSFATIKNIIKSFTIKDLSGNQQKTYLLGENSPLYRLDENFSEKPKEIVRFEGYYLAEFQGADNNKDGKIDPTQGEYATIVAAELVYGVLTEYFPIAGGKYELSVETTDGETISVTSSDVFPGVLLPPVTDINAAFVDVGDEKKFNVSWKLPDYYVNNYDTYKNATIEIRVDRYTEDGNHKNWRARVRELPMFVNGNKFENYSFFQWESDIFGVRTPYIKVQVRTRMNYNNRGNSDWREFKIDRYTVTPMPVPIPSNLTQAQLDQLMNELFMKTYDIQQGGAGLREIQTLLNTPLGQRNVSTTYSGQLGPQINTIIQMLLSSGKKK